jgi:uncharacterized membrane protein HdeD (DUF308 family)
MILGFALLLGIVGCIGVWLASTEDQLNIARFFVFIAGLLGILGGIVAFYDARP